MKVFWYFVIYSFIGFLLEVAFARLVRAEKQDRKCFWLLPLCPVYGLGALAILALPRWTSLSGLWLAAAGGLAATGVEYLMSVFYERWLKVSFWDYSHFKGNVHGRVCPIFSLFWGVLAAVLLKWVHPAVAALAADIPAPLTLAALLLVAADSVWSAALLRRTGTTDSLRWYDRIQKNTAG